MLIFLIGFMGSGKSYSARKLASALKMPYVDMDAEIERMEQRSIKQIFKADGEDYFRKLEHEYLQNLDKERDLIVSTGGGSPCYLNNMQIIKEKGLSIYLNVDEEVIFNRLKRGIYKRPLLQGLTDEELKSFIKKKIESRASYYNQANLIVKKFNTRDLIGQIRSFTSTN